MEGMNGNLQQAVYDTEKLKEFHDGAIGLWGALRRMTRCGLPAEGTSWNLRGSDSLGTQAMRER